jgi:hypothetical protein
MLGLRLLVVAKFTYKPVLQWLAFPQADSPMTTWLHKHNLHEYASLFFDEKITFKVLSLMTQQELKDVGVKSFGDRKRMVSAIARKQAEIYEECVSAELVHSHTTQLADQVRHQACGLHGARLIQ